MGIEKRILDILACPKCKGGIRFNEVSDYLICDSCNLGYPVVDDIPVMLVDEAVSMEGQSGDGAG